jgi:opacity protein-like surface antigen
MTIRPIVCWGNVACALLALSGVARAETRFGVHGGATLHTQVESPSEEDVEIGNRTAFSAGLLLDIDVSDRLWIRFAPGWVEKGSTIGFELFGDDVEARFKLGYVELPMTLNVSVSSGSVRPYVTGGGTVAYLARARVAGRNPDGVENEEDAKESFEDWDFGLTLGGGLEFGERTRGFVEGRYTWGLANVAADSDDFSLKNRGWQVLAGLTFGL